MRGRSRARGLAPALAALGAGGALPLAFAPLGWWPVAPLAIAALLGLLGSGPARVAFGRGWLFGLGLFGTGSSWVYVSIHTYGAAPVPLAALLTLLFCGGLALFPALCAWAWARWLRQRRGGVVLGFPAVWILGEWLRGWILTGFPWLYLGYSQVDGPLAFWAPVLGVFGVGWIVALSGAAVFAVLFELLSARGRAQRRSDRSTHFTVQRVRPFAPVLLVALLWIAAWPLARIEWTTPAGPSRSVALVQGNIPQLLKWDPDHLDTTLAVYTDLSELHWGADFVVWPESAVPAYLDRATDFLSAQASRAAAAGSALLLGIPSRDADDSAHRGYHAFNSVIALGRDSGIYHKRRLVPFGEYVPLESVLRGLIAFFDLPMSSFASGPDAQQPLAAHGLEIGTFVCYEIAYPDLVRTALPGASLLLTVSNDTWFGASLGPLQHLEIARLRALENGRDLMRGTNNGISALVDARGQVTARGEQFTREVVRGTVQPRRGATPFARFGSWPVVGLCVLLAAALGVAPRNRSDSPYASTREPEGRVRPR